MSDNDLISRSHFDDRVRLAAGPDADEEFSADFLDGVKTVLYMLSTEPPVELPMNAVEYETALDRMEDSVDGFEIKKLWNEAISLGFIEKAVAIVKKWAREHPEERSK